MSDSWTERKLSRRQMLQGMAVIASGGAISALVGCGPTEAPAPTVAAAATAAPTVPPTVAPTPTMSAQAMIDEAIKTGMIRALEPNPKYGGTLRWAGWFGGTGFDPYINLTRDVTSKTHNNLLRWNPMDGFRTVIPELALSYEGSADGLFYTFKLRPGVKWHDGTDFSADDVVATYARLISPPEGIVMPTRSNLDFLAGVEAIDSMTVRFELSAPVYYFINMISYSGFPVLQKKALEENDLDLSTVYSPGTGPFVFQDYKSGESWAFTRNPNYWNPNLPYLDEVHLLHMTDWNQRGTAVLTGQAEFAQLTTTDMYKEGLLRSDVVGVSQHEGEHACVGFEFNCEHPPLDDPRVRRAIFLAVNRHDLQAVYSEPTGIASSRWIGNSSPDAMPEAEILKIPGYKKDNTEEIAMAKQLMADAGYPDGFGPIEIVTGNNPNHADVLAPAMQAELKKLNIESTIRVVEVANRGTEARNGTFDMIITVYLKSTTNDFVQAWKNSFRTGASGNYAKYSNPEVDKVIDQILVEPDAVARKQLYYQGMDLLDRDPPHYMLGFTLHQAMWRNELKGHFEEVRLFTVYNPPDTFWLDV